MKTQDPATIRGYNASNGRRATLEEVAVVFGVTPERVRQIEEQAIRKLWRGRIMRHREAPICQQS